MTMTLDFFLNRSGAVLLIFTFFRGRCGFLHQIAGVAHRFGIAGVIGALFHRDLDAIRL